MSKKDYVHVIRLPTGSTIVTKWLSEFDLPLIATCLGYQILSIDKGDDHVPKNRLAREINYIKPPDFSLPEYRNTI
ncbi:MAG: hypothetical protein WBE61_12610 [Nitrososphaeraceae archaeon]